MKFTVVVHDPHDDHAVRFTHAVLEAGHEIPLVFFYQEAVRIADLKAHPEQIAGWQKLQQQWDLELAICIGAASRRGLVDESTPDASLNRIADGFEIVGLGQLVGAIAESDRLITFAA